MPTELEELVEFLHHGNTQIRQVAAENLVGFTISQPDLFKRNQLEPIKDLKLLVRDYAPIAKNAVTMLVNLSEDQEIIKSLADDTDFTEVILSRITSATEPTADLLAMLLPNLSKHKPFATRLLTLTRAIPKPLSTSDLAIDQLLDLFVKGAAGTYNKNASYDYLAYLFADLAQYSPGRKHLLTPRREGDANDSSAPAVMPLAKLVVFTEHASAVRRRGVASAIKNVAFEVEAHPRLLTTSAPTALSAIDGDGTSSVEDGAIDLLPYLHLPLMGSEEYPDEDSDLLPDECQLLPPDKAREPDLEIVKTHLETLLLLTSTRPGRDELRGRGVYPVVRELHLAVEDEGVREACDRLVQVVMRKEEGEGDDEEEQAAKAAGAAEQGRVVEVDEEDELIEVL